MHHADTAVWRLVGGGGKSEEAIFCLVWSPGREASWLLVTAPLLLIWNPELVPLGASVS
jgi:hypothetical protein